MATQRLKDLSAKAARGIMLTLDELREFVASTRVSYTAAEAKVKPPKETDGTKLSRVKKEVPKDVDFF